MILSVLNDQVDKLVSCHSRLNFPKKLAQTVVNHVESLNDQAGKLINAHQ